MIPARYAEGPCYRESVTDPEKKAKHEGHQSVADCYHLTWDEVPLPWVKRRTRVWHLAIGIRKDTGHVQLECNVGNGPGPFLWREVPTLRWEDEPGQWFCRRCVAEWTKGVYSVTVRVDGIKVTKGALKALVSAVGGTDIMEITLRPTDIEDKPALVAVVRHTEEREEYEERFLVVGSNAVKL